MTASSSTATTPLQRSNDQRDAPSLVSLFSSPNAGKARPRDGRGECDPIDIGRCDHCQRVAVDGHGFVSAAPTVQAVPMQQPLHAHGRCQDHQSHQRPHSSEQRNVAERSETIVLERFHRGLPGGANPALTGSIGTARKNVYRPKRRIRPSRPCSTPIRLACTRTLAGSSVVNLSAASTEKGSGHRDCHVCQAPQRHVRTPGRAWHRGLSERLQRLRRGVKPDRLVSFSP